MSGEKRYEDMTYKELQQKVKEQGIQGRSRLTTKKLMISALRSRLMFGASGTSRGNREKELVSGHKEKEKNKTKEKELQKFLTTNELKQLTQVSKRVLPAKLATYPSKILGTVLSYLPIKFKLNNVKYIIGPITLTEHYSKELRKTVYVFGDVHELESKCPPDVGTANSMRIDEFIEQILFENSDKVFDLFLEVLYPEELTIAKRGYRVYPHTNFLKILKDIFQECFYHKGNCLYPNLRAHWTDFRDEDYVYGVKTGGLTVGNLCQTGGSLFVSSYENRGKDDRTNTETEGLRKELFAMMDNLPQNARDPASVLDNPVISKQLNSIKSSGVKDYLISSFLERSGRATTNLWDLKRQGSKNYQSIGVEAIELCDSIMDLYLMARMFREFKRKEMSEGRYSKSPSNIIVYAGEYHSNYYRNALAALGFEMVNKSVSTEKGRNYQCINVEKFYPWFSRS